MNQGADGLRHDAESTSAEMSDSGGGPRFQGWELHDESVGGALRSYPFRPRRHGGNRLTQSLTTGMGAAFAFTCVSRICCPLGVSELIST